MFRGLVSSLKDSISDVFDQSGALRYRSWLTTTTARAEAALGALRQEMPVDVKDFFQEPSASGGSGLQYSEAIDYSVGSSTSVAAPAVAPAAPESGSTAEASEAAREAHATRMRRLAVLLRPLLSALDGESAALAPVVAGNERGVHRMRVVLLALWACTLKLLAPALESYALRVDVGVAYSTLSRILLRAEFGPQYLMLDVHGRPTCDSQTLSNARRYRRLLRATHRFVIEQLGAATQLSSTQPFTLFAVRSLAVAYFRVPGAATELVDALSLNDDEYASLPAAEKQPLLRLRDEAAQSGSRNSSSLGTAQLARRKSSAARRHTDAYPSLYMWPHFHSALLAVNKQRRNTRSSRRNTGATPTAAATGTDAAKPDEGRTEQNDSAASATAETKATTGNDAQNEDRGDSKEVKNGIVDAAEANSAENAAESRDVDGAAAATTADGASADADDGADGLPAYSDGGDQNGASPAASASSSSATPVTQMSPKITPPLLYNETSLADAHEFRVDDNAWLRILQQQGATGRVLYFLFFNEWLQHVRREMRLDDDADSGDSDSSVPAGERNARKRWKHLLWPLVPGFETLALAFVYHMSTLQTYHKSVLDCADQLLRATPSVLSAYVHMTFTKTRAHEPMHILSTLSYVERWLGQLRLIAETVPDSFDIDFFLLGLERIIETDHHQVLMVLLTFLYKQADLFEHTARRQLFGNFVLRKHFYELFLHWDTAVRTTFLQLLLFRLVRVRRTGSMSTAALERRINAASSARSVSLSSKGATSSSSSSSSSSLPASSPELPSAAAGRRKSSDSALPEHHGAKNADDHHSQDDSSEVLRQKNNTKRVTMATLTSAALSGALMRECETDTDAIDAELLSKLEAHLRLMCDQLEDPHAVQVFPKHLEVYADRAQREWLFYLSRFVSWKGTSAPPLVSAGDASSAQPSSNVAKPLLSRISTKK